MYSVSGIHFVVISRLNITREQKNYRKSSSKITLLQKFFNNYLKIKQLYLLKPKKINLIPILIQKYKLRLVFKEQRNRYKFTFLFS